jgi:hypothetical protein
METINKLFSVLLKGVLILCILTISVLYSFKLSEETAFYKSNKNGLKVSLSAGEIPGMPELNVNVSLHNEHY